MIVGQTVRVAHDQYASTCGEDYTGMEGVVINADPEVGIYIKIEGLPDPVAFDADELEVVESVENRG